jgi:hypothetical protein
VNVDAMLASMTWKQFLEWEQFSELEPFGEERADIRTASIVATIANANRDPKKRAKAYSLHDCLLRFGDMPSAERKKTWQEMKAIAMLYAGLSGAKPRAKPGKKG